MDVFAKDVNLVKMSSLGISVEVLAPGLITVSSGMTGIMVSVGIVIFS